jgi:hypothetical protein
VSLKSSVRVLPSIAACTKCMTSHDFGIFCSSANILMVLSQSDLCFLCVWRAARMDGQLVPDAQGQYNFVGDLVPRLAPTANADPMYMQESADPTR